jgi:raffinose/stachyose/melibiose transport system substrate-binding protein
MLNKKYIGGLLALAVALSGLAGCSGTPETAPSSEAPATQAASEAPASEAPADDGGVSKDCEADASLVVGHSEAGDVIQKGFMELAAKFEADRGVKVEVQSKSWADSQETIRLAMSGDAPPDVMQGNEGWTIDGALWQAGLIADLDPYAELYGWNTAFPESALVVNRFTDDGTTMGEGNLVAIPQAIQYVGVFYNKDNLAKLGVTDVTTLDTKAAFMDLIKKAKDEGMLPVMLGDSEKWPALHNLSLFNGWYDDPQTINNWVLNVPGSTYDTPGRLKGSQDFQDWYTNGYFNKDALALTQADAIAKFNQGEGVFFVTGTWALGDVSKGLGEKAGFMLWPANDEGKHEAVGGYSLPFTISTKTKFPNCAAAFIDYVTASDDAIAAQVASGRPSATTKGLDVQIDDPLLAQMVSEYKRLNAENGLFTWEDWPTTTMGTLMGSESQRLLTGEITAQEYNSAVQKDWDEFMAER